MIAASLLVGTLALAPPAPRPPTPPPTARYVAETERGAKRSFLVGGLLLGSTMLLRLRAVLVAQRPPPDADFDRERSHWNGDQAARITSALTAVAGLSLLADGSYHAAEVRALRGQSVVQRPALGWTLAGVGGVMMIAAHTVPLACFETTCAMVTADAQFMVGVAVAGTGLSLAALSLGHRRGRRRLQVAPTYDRRTGTSGLTLSGRF